MSTSKKKLVYRGPVISGPLLTRLQKLADKESRRLAGLIAILLEEACAVREAEHRLIEASKKAA